MVKPLHPLDSISTRIPSGNGRRVQFERNGTGAAVDDPAAAAIQALAAPLNYPPLSVSIVPGDRVAIAVDASVPCALEIVLGTLSALTHAGVDLEAISVVVASSELAQLFRKELTGSESGGVQVVLHDPDDEANLCFIGLTKRAAPLVVNRAIHEADLVLPIGVARPGGGAFDSLFPQFSSAAVIDLHRTPANVSSPVERKARHQETREAGWLIGAAMVMLVVPGPDDSVAHVLAGEPKSVSRRGSELYRELWSRRSAQPVGLAIATVTGGPLAQTWQNVGKALAAATRMLDESGGAIAICTNLDRPLGESMGRLVGASDLERTRRKLFHEHAEDSWSAWQMARALTRGPVYLLSQLEAEQVEEMGLAPIADVDELVRLASRQESFAVLSDAQHVLAGVGSEAADE